MIELHLKVLAWGHYLKKIAKTECSLTRKQTNFRRNNVTDDYDSTLDYDVQLD